MAHPRIVSTAAGLTLVILLTVQPAQAQPNYTADDLAADLKLLEQAKLPTGDKDLLNFFKNRVLSDMDRERIEALIQQMASPKFKEREQAEKDVEKEGPRALPLLRKMLQGNPELELRLRIEQRIKSIVSKSPNTLDLAAARVLKHRRVDGGLAVLLDYLPLAPDDAVEEELFACIYSLALAGARLEVLLPAVKAGKLDPIMPAMLRDKEPTRRAIAALVVGRYGAANQRQAVAKLLADADPHVRFRAAQGLAASRDKSGVPVLLELLENGPMKVAYQAESLLNLIAQDKGPTAPLGETKALRQKSHAAWKEWWDKNSATIDLARVETDVPFGGTVARASQGALDFIKAVFSGDVAKVAKVTEVPFALGGQTRFNTRQEFDDFLNLLKDQVPPRDMKFKVIKVVPGNEYVKKAPEEEREFLKTSRLAQIQVVYLEGEEGGRDPEIIPFFMRNSGSQARCIGVGESQRNEKSK